MAISSNGVKSQLSYQLDEDLMEEVRQCFRDGKSKVVGAFRVHTITHKQFSLQTKLKAKVLCISLKAENNGFKCRLSTVKVSTNEPSQVKDSWKLKQIASLRAPDAAAVASKSSSESQHQQPQVVIQFTGSATETFLFSSQSARSAFLGCVLVYNQKTYKKRLECVGFNPTNAVTVWRQAVSSSEVRETNDKPEAVDSLLEDTKDEEAFVGINELENFIDRSRFPLNDLKGLDSYLQSQLFELDSLNINGILSNVEEVDGVISRVDDTLEYVDDLEEWLNVFNTKLTHMRIDISTIEERNNALETKSDNNSALLKELQRLQQSLQLDDVTLQNIIIANFNEKNIDLAVEAARKLHQLLCKFEMVSESGKEDEDSGDSLPTEFLGMKAVKEKKAELKQLKNTWMSRAKTFLISLFAETVDRALTQTEMQHQKSFIRAIKEIVNNASRELYGTCKSYIGLIDVLIMFDSSMADSLAEHYAQNVNRLINRYVKLICSKPKHILMQLSPSYIEEEEENTNAKGKSSVKVKRAKSMFIDQLEKPNEEIPELFAHILDQLMPKICKDCTFCGICFFSRNREEAGSWLEKEPKFDASFEWSDKDALKSTIRILLKDAPGDIFEFINQALKLDDAFSIPFMKLISYWIYRMEGHEEHFQTVQWLQEIQAIAISTFKTYMDTHMSLIENPNMFKMFHGNSVKGLWILQYFLKFPRIVEHVESLSQQAEEVGNVPQQSDAIYSLTSDLIEDTYCKYSEKIFEALEDLVAAEVKACHADRLRIENYEFYCSSIGSYQMSLPHLSRYFTIASKRKEAAKQRYIKDALEWSTFADTFRFLHRLEQLRKDIPASDISFQYGFTPNDLLMAISCISKDINTIRTQAVAVRNRIQKHFRNDQILFKQMLKEVFKELQAGFETLCRDVQECYQSLGEVLPWEDIQVMLKDVKK